MTYVKVLAVCGMGIGTSVLLKMNAESALCSLGLDGEVEVADIGTARGAAATADLVLTSAELAGELRELSVPVLSVTNFMDTAEIAGRISQGLGIA